MNLEDKILNPYFVTGLIDGEGYFTITIHKSNKVNTGWRVKANFEIGLNVRDEMLLNQLQKFFGGIGTFKKDLKANALKYSVADLKDITTIILPHFKKYPLLTQKGADFLLFEQIINLMNEKNHLNYIGLKKIISIKASLNKGLSKAVQTEFKDIIPEERKIIRATNIPDPN